MLTLKMFSLIHSSNHRGTSRRRLARFIFATLLIVGSLGFCAAYATSIEGADPTTAKEPAAESVMVGLHVERISEVNDTARTFTAEFELGLRYRGAFDPKDLLLLDTLKPLVLDQPEESTDRDGEHFRLFHLNATFRFKSESKDITRNVHKLAIQLCRRNPPAGRFQFIPDMGGMGLDKAGASWGDVLRDDDVLSGVAGWEMQSGEVKSGPLNVTQRFGGEPESGLVATMTIRRVVVSPKAIVAALIPPKVARDLALGALAVLAVLLAGTWSRPARRISRRHVLLIRLLLGTLGFFLFESWTMTTAQDRLTIDGCRKLSILFEGLWWFIPAVCINAVLPSFVWGPISRRTGHPVPSISRMLVRLAVYFFALTMALHFVSGAPMGNIWAASGVMGIVLGLALQSLILDLFAGMMLNVEKPFKILQWVRLEGGTIGFATQVGQVLEMNWRTTRLWTRDNDIISIPNSTVSKAKITNFAMPTAASRLEFMIVLDYSIPPSRARHILKQGALRAVETGKVLADPQPDVVVVAAEDTAIRYKIQFYANLTLVSESSALTDAVEGVMSRLADEGIDPWALFARPVAVAPRRPDANGSRGNEPLVPAAIGEGVADSPLQNLVTASTETPSTSPISPEQVHIIQHTWSLVKPIADDVARLFYDRLFQLDPSLKPMFRTDPKAQHAKLIGMLCIIVRGIGNLDNLIGTVQDLGMRHVNYAVRDEHYDTVGAALLWTLEQGLGKEWTPEAQAAWVAAYGVLASVMKSAAHPSLPVPLSAEFHASEKGRIS
jgi:small-conductance mechanosensitive channel/hemoglobin-like flavoprotein